MTPRALAPNVERLGVLPMAFVAVGRPVEHDDARPRWQRDAIEGVVRHHVAREALDRRLDAQRAADVYIAEIARLSAERALASEEGRRMELFGQALIEQEADADARGQKKAAQELRSEYLLIDDRKQTVETQQPVTLVRSSDVFKADRMVASQQENRLQMDGRVRGTLMPRP